MAGYYELKPSSNGFHFTLKAGNHEVILSGRVHASREAAMAAITAAQQAAGDAARYEKKESSNGKPYFTLTAPDGSVLGSSEMYESTRSRDDGMASVMKNGTSDKVKELVA
ncbi:MAG: YegP family protein [Gemmatimonadaceae bacterium]|jgi:hypothetical protein|nr:YegP family protein [Gemmatimonadaceae bacterium]